MSTEIKSSDPCPICLLQNKAQNNLMNRPGQFYSSCAAGHKFEDTDELNMLRTQAKAKYPQLYRASAPTPPDPTAFANTDIVITADLKKMIENMAGQTFTGGQDLKGLIFMLVQDNKDKENELRSMRATISTMRTRTAGGKPAMEPGQIVVSIPEWAHEGAISQAEHAGMSLEDWTAQEFEGFLENYFGATRSSA